MSWSLPGAMCGDQVSGNQSGFPQPTFRQLRPDERLQFAQAEIAIRLTCPQALALLNDPFVAGQSGFWAYHLIADKALTVESRLDSMFRAELGRWPDDAERARFTGLAKEVASLRLVTPDKLLDSRDVWKDVAHAIFNLKEFIYLR